MMRTTFGLLLLIEALPGVLPNALRDLKYKWPKGIVPFDAAFEITEDELYIIAAAMDEIHQKSCIRFRNKVESDRDYLVILNTSLCVAPVGRQGDGQEMSFGPECFTHDALLHQLLTTLGFINEHMRPDRDQYVVINWENIEESEMFEKWNPTDISLLGIPYDYNSIMHYTGTAFSKNGFPTIVPKTGNITLGSDGHLSPLDIKKINKYYGCDNAYKINVDMNNNRTSGGNKVSPDVEIINLIILFSFGPMAFLVVVIVVIVFKHKKEKKALENLYKQLMKETNAPIPTLQHPLDENVSVLPYKKEYEIERNRLMLGEKIGEGQFGHVWTGCLKRARALDDRAEEETLAVAIKGPQDGQDPTHHKALADELRIMCAIGQHPNVLALVGAVTKNIIHGEFFVITELCGRGNLKKYLEDRRSRFIDELRRSEKSEADDVVLDLSKRSLYANEFDLQWALDAEQDRLLPDSSSLTTSDLLSFAMQVAQGMEYLSGLPCIHRDLAARNVLITSNFVCRVADFGLARHEDKEYYRQKSDCMVPFKWMSIEALEQGLYTVESDMWSFGILLYEIFTLGGIPYPGIGPEDLFTKLKDGHRNTKPTYCHEEIYQLMQQCWQRAPADRPAFTFCVNLLKSHLKRSSPQLLSIVQNSIVKEEETQKSLVGWSAPDVNSEEDIQEARCICCTTRSFLRIWSTLAIVSYSYRIYDAYNKRETAFAKGLRSLKSIFDGDEDTGEEQYAGNLGTINLAHTIANLYVAIFVLLASSRRRMLNAAFWVVIARIIFNFPLEILRYYFMYDFKDRHDFINIVILSAVCNCLVYSLDQLWLAWAIQRTMKSTRQKTRSNPGTSLRIWNGLVIIIYGLFLLIIYYEKSNLAITMCLTFLVLHHNMPNGRFPSTVVVLLIGHSIDFCIDIFAFIAAVRMKRQMLQIAFWMVIGSTVIIRPIELLAVNSLFFAVIIQGLLAWAIKRTINFLKENEGPSEVAPAGPEYPLMPVP